MIILRSMIGLLGWCFSIGFTLLIIGGVAGVMLFNHYSRDLPEYSQLAQYDPPTVTRLYASDGRLMAEYASEKRVFVPLEAIPKRVRQAFLSAEDKNFYDHTGIDFTGIARTIRDNIIYYGQGRSLVGGSTITQQVVKNFLLSNEKSLERKIKEAILAIRINDVYSKDKILELYLNEIFLGSGSYGVAAAALNYFNKPLDALTIEDAALLAALPKAPSTYNPRRKPELAKDRRDWVINRMAEDGHISPLEAQEAIAAPIALRARTSEETTRADFFAEEVRRWLKARYGDNILYEGGLVVKTTLNPALQQAADNALRHGLIAYDRRRGYRGALATLNSLDSWKEQLVALEKQHAHHIFAPQRLAVVMDTSSARIDIEFSDGSKGQIPFSLLKWTRRVIADGQLGPEIKRPSDLVKPRDVILAAPISDAQRKTLSATDEKLAYDLQQIPEVNGTLVALDPHTGRVLAMSGGYAFGGSEFNRATQARRQPGSAFKPFVYLAGLENGFTPATILLDAPVELSQGAGQPTWRPQNFRDEYLGPITLRTGLEKSRNTITVRLAQIIGIDKALEIGRRLGIYDDMPRNFSIVLGAAETTALRLTNAYGMLVNGGKQIVPTLVERIDDRHGTTIYRRDSRTCLECQFASFDELPSDNTPPTLEDDREQVIDPRVAYQITSMLEGVTIRGTATRANTELKRPLGGKTGTTNDSRDVWFVGFSPDLVVGVYVGYDQPRTLGRKETGSSVALPIFIDFMRDALANEPRTPFRIPKGIQLVNIDSATGLPTHGVAEIKGKSIMEAFLSDATPIFVPGRELEAPKSEFESAPEAQSIQSTPEVNTTPEYEADTVIPEAFQPVIQESTGSGLY